ncbi:hypothetical protein CGLAUT_12200 [Corynebacterium glaucum]|uniref:hypothetical protein n=1 Tax=Corynebacterium glaucum TaxID=187491 RepID=UPI0025B2F284|nr:hypothetical protein [Corynebacterium glaucum]WJZ08892.1 hypothetical protein CGLAUT_12200 [Corynebacterium glaucum]
MSRLAPRAFVRALAAGAATSLTTVLTAVLTAPAASALAVPLDPSNPEVAEEWANPAVRPGEGQVAELSLVDAPSVVENEPFHVKLRVINRTDAELRDLTITPHRAPATGSVRDQRVASVASTSEYTTTGSSRDLPTGIEAGRSVVFELSIDPDELALTTPGTYPLLFELDDGSGAPLSTERFHVTVPGQLPEGAQPAGVSVLYPITAQVDILAGETGEAPESPQLVLASEDLADQLAPGGRLTELADAYLEAAKDPAVEAATCVALDPALIETVDRMADGYIVADERAPVVEEPKRLRDSWGDEATETHGNPGKGAEDAAAWLAKVRLIAESGCTVAMPWANADLNALARTGDPWMVREAIERGPFVLGRVLGFTGVTNVVVPPAGYTEADAVPVLGWGDHSRSTIPEEGLSGSWERAVASATANPGAEGPQDNDRPLFPGEGSRSSLERFDTVTPAWAAAPEPVSPVRVLVAADTAVPAGGSDERFAWMAPGVMAVRFQDSLGATLAAMGQQPATVGYSNEPLRYDYALDSPAARNVNAAAAVRLALQNAVSFESEPAAQPVLVNAPAHWDADAAAVLLGTVADVLHSGTAAPVAFDAYLEVPADTAVPPAERVGTEYADPTVFSDSEILNATQQTRFINDLSTLLAPDPSIALTRYGFTLPLRRDILTAFSLTRRQSMAEHTTATEASAARLTESRGVLGELRSAVNLIPPGNVYTRTSPSSPLLIVAQNGMPLPVDTAILYTAPDGARLNVPDSVRIPARGSVTLQMTADLPRQARSTDLKLYLAGPQGHAISQPVEISVRTPSSAVPGWVLLAIGTVGAALLLLYSVGKRQKRSTAARSQSPPWRIASRKAPPRKPPNPPPEPRDNELPRRGSTQ